jgi:hypothetical protein
LQYGVNFNGTVGQAVQLSGWLKNGIEVRGSMTFSYTNSQTSNISPQTIYANGNGDRPLAGTYTSASSSASVTITPTISVVKHFPLKSKLDFFIGGSANCGFTSPTAWTKSATTQVADSFYSYSATNSKAPLAINWGLSLVGGANFFFYKNLAIGFSASNGNGNSLEQQVEINYGQNNSSIVNYNTSFTNRVSNTKYSASLAGNAGLHLTYYLKVKPKKQSGEQKM